MKNPLTLYQVHKYLPRIRKTRCLDHPILDLLHLQWFQRLLPVLFDFWEQWN